MVMAASAALAGTVGFDWKQILAGEKPVDPYLVWADLTDFTTLRARSVGAVAVIAELEAHDVAAALKAVRKLGFDVPTLYDVPLIPKTKPNAPPAVYARVVTLRCQLEKLPKLFEVQALGRFQLSLARTLANTLETKSPPRLAASKIVMGVIDDGCPFAHPSLVDSKNNSRVRFVWDQTPSVPRRNGWTIPTDTRYGREIVGLEIDSRLQASGSNEALTYAAAGYRRFSEWGSALFTEGSHGMGVLHAVAGHPGVLPQDAPQSTQRDAAAKAPIVFVQVPSYEVGDTSGGWLSAAVLDGLRYIVNRAEVRPDLEQDVKQKIAINVSFGGMAGSHDGTSLLETGMREVMEKRGNVAIVLAAGNAQRYDTYGDRFVWDREPGLFRFFVPPDKPNESFLELWIDETHAEDQRFDPSQLSVSITSPTGARVGPIGYGAAETMVDAGTPIAALIAPNFVPQSTHRRMILLAVRPTRVQRNVMVAPAGVWTVTLKYDCANDRSKAIRVHAWVERDDLLKGNRRTQQARLVQDDSGLVQPTHRLSSIANGEVTPVVGGYRMKSLALAEYSGFGPSLRPSPRIDPDLSAPSDLSPSLRGLRVHGNRGGVHRRMGGTSIAAPIATRWIANEMAAHRGDFGFRDFQALITRYDSGPMYGAVGGWGRVVIGGDDGLPLKASSPSLALVNAYKRQRQLLEAAATRRAMDWLRAKAKSDPAYGGSQAPEGQDG